MDNNSLILIVRIGVKGETPDATKEIINETKKIFEKNNIQGNMTVFYLADYDTQNSTIECLNPKLVTPDTFKEAEEKLKKLNEELDKLLSKS